jgi:hypothetical protein
MFQYIYFLLYKILYILYLYFILCFYFLMQIFSLILILYVLFVYKSVQSYLDYTFCCAFLFLPSFRAFPLSAPHVNLHFMRFCLTTSCKPFYHCFPSNFSHCVLPIPLFRYKLTFCVLCLFMVNVLHLFIVYCIKTYLCL